METTIKRKQNKTLADLTAGLTTGVANIPDAMASSILAGVNPVQGLYASMIGTPLGAIFGNSAFMNVAVTSALAIAKSTLGASTHAAYQAAQRWLDSEPAEPAKYPGIENP
jgi:sulfate permease, SulP family